MTVLEQLKLENPSLALLPDDLIVEKLLDDYQGDLDPDTFREQLLTGSPNVIEKPVTVPTAAPTAGKRPIGVGSNPQDIGYGQAFTSGLKSMWQRTWGPGVNYLKGGIAGLFGDESTAQQYYEEAREQDQEILNRTGYVTFEQATKGPDAGIDTFIKFGLQQAGMSLPYTLFGGVGGIAGRAVLGQAIGKTAATMTGATASFLPTTAQFNIARQVEEVERGNLDEVNEAAAFGAALPAAILESALYPVLGKLFGPLSRTQFSNVISSATLGRVAKGSAAGAVTEAITEVGQQAIERYQAGLPIDSPDALNEYKEAAAGAAFVGGLFGGATTTAGEIARTVQPTPTDAPVTQPIERAAQAPVEAPRVEAGIIQPQQQKETSQTEATQEQAKPVNFSVEQEADKFVVKRQDLDENNNVIKTTPIGAPTTQEAATKLQQEAQDQKNKLPEQTFFTADEIKQQDPTLGNIIDEVEIQGGKISPGTKQVYYRKDLALPEGDLTNVMNSGGTAGSVADGWYDRTSDLVYVSLADLGKANETVAHENFHALQRVTDRVSPNLFTEQEQTALDTFLPGGTIDSITPNVQRALGNDVMNTLRERHADRNISNREMQAYAFGAYATLKNKNRLLSAPNPVIRAFKKLFDFIKSAGNIFKKNKINNVKDIFDKARLGDIGKRAKTQPDVDALRTKSLAQAEKAAAKGVIPTKFEYSVTTKKYRGRDVGTILPSLDSAYGSDIFDKIYNSAARKPQLKQEYSSQVRPEQRNAINAVIDMGYQEKELIDDGGYLVFQEKGKSYRVGVQTGGRNLSREYTPQELTQIGKSLKTALSIAETRKDAPELSLSKIELNNKETQYLDELVNQRFDGGTLIDDYAPSIKVRGSTFTISKNEIGKFDEYLDEFNDTERKSRGGEGMLSIPYRLRKLEYGKKRLHKITNDLDKAETISESDVDEGRPELALSTVKIRKNPLKEKFKLTKDLGKYFDDMQSVSDPMDNKAFKAAVRETAKEVEYQKDQVLNGIGWYSKDAKDTFDALENVFPTLKSEAHDKDLFGLLTAITSVNRNPRENVELASRIYYYYKKHGVIPVKNPETEKFWSMPGVSKQLTLLQYMLDKFGIKGTVDYVKSEKTIREMGKVQRDSGKANYGAVINDNYLQTAKPSLGTGKGLDSSHFGAFMFGPKVGRFYLDIKGIKDNSEAEGVTKDVWFSRSFYRQFGQLTDKTPSSRDGLKGAMLKKHEQRADEFARELAKATNLTPNDAQAALWYYEHELYADTVKQAAKLYSLSDGAKKYIKNFKENKYGEIKSENPNPSVEVRNRIERAKGEVKEEKTLTKDEAAEVKTELELSVSTGTAVRDIDVDAFQKSGSDVTAFSPEEYLAAVETRGPLVGHCAACTYVVQKNFGGDIMKVLVSPIKGYNTKRESHYFNRLPDGTFIDLTGEQYGNKGITPPKDFIDRATVSPYQWGKFDPKQSKEENKATAGVVSINPKFVKFEEKFGKEKTTQNLDELTPELSISENKTLLNPPGTKVTTDIAEDFEILENIGMSPMDDNIASDIQNHIDDSYSDDIKNFGEPVNIPDTNIPLFLFGIKVDGKAVGYGFGVRLGDTAYIDNVALYNESISYLSPSAFRRIGTQLSKQLGVKNFAGTRVTGARKKAAQERGRRPVPGLDFDTVSTDFSQQQFDESDAVQFSVSDKMLTDKEIRDSKLPSNVKAKLFENRKLKDGTPVSIRPNLNGQVVRDDKNLFIQTIHPRKDLNKALGYDGAVTVTDPFLNVSQKARANIASKRQNKFPMAAVQGKLSKKKATLEGQVLSYNPNKHHLFVDPAGYAVKSIKGDAVMFNTKVYTTGTLNYYSKEDAPTPLENIESKVLYKYETEAEKKADQPLETDTLSKEKLREFNLEFAASDKKYKDETLRILGTINPKRSRKTMAAHWKDFTDNWGVKFRQGVADQYISVKKFIGEEEYKALTMTYGSSGATESALLYGVPFMDNNGALDLKENTIGKGLFTRFEKLGNDLPDFLAWVAANRARNLVNKGFESGMGNIKDINIAINDLQKGNEKQFNESLKDLQEFNKAFLDIAVKSGYLDPASAKVWTEDSGYNFYIPFYRLLEDPDSNSGPRAASDIVNQPDYPKYRGADMPINDLLQNIIRNYSFLTEASLKNAAGLKTLEKGVEMGVARRVPNKTKTSVFVRNKGKIQNYEVDNKLVLESLTKLYWNGFQNPAMNILTNFKRYLTYGVTASPAFRIRNLIRDSIHSVAVGKLKYNPFGNVMEGMKGLNVDKKLGASELRARMAFGGGSIHFGHVYGDDPNATKMLLDRAIDVNTVMKQDGWAPGARRVIGSKLRNSLKWWEENGSYFENVNRAALYKQLRNKGVSHFEASYQARDLLNFSRHGANPLVRALTQSIPFLNARIQGLDKLGRAMSKEQRAQLLTVLGTYSLASIGLYLAYKDDEDFKEREQWDRDTYHWFKLPNDAGVFRIPRPFEVGAVGVIFERMVEQMVDDDVHGQLLAERISHVITETFAVDIRPQAITPVLEIYSNKDSFTGRNIESMAMKRLPASERKYAYTSSAYVGTSKILELIPWETIQLSPVQIEHLVQGYFGWVGSTVVSAVSVLDYKRKYAEFFTTGFDSPLGMGFFKGLPSMQSKYKTQFYNQLEAMNDVFDLQRLYQSRGEYKKALKLGEKNKNVLQWRASYVKVNTKINQLNREIRRIQADKNLVESEKIDKVKQLNIIKNDMIQNLTEAVLSWEKSTGERVKRPLWWNK